MHQLLMIAIGYMVSYTVANLGWVWPSLHWLIGLLTLFAVVRWEVGELRKIERRILENILARRQIEDAKNKQN